MKILFVGMAHSVHTARWISQISDQGWDIHVFDMMEAGVNNELKGATTYTVFPPDKGHDNLVDWKSDYPFRRGARMAKSYLPGFMRNRLFPSRKEKLAKLIREIRPDIIHSLEMQNQSYPLLDVKKTLGSEFTMPWIYSSWGNDIYYFRHLPNHLENIRGVLASCDYYIADCDRDTVLAREFGFSGEILGVFPTAGGYDVNLLRESVEYTRPSMRRMIALKGYHHWQGRALLALEALKLCAEEVRGYTIEIYSPGPEIVKMANDLVSTGRLDIKILPYSRNAEIIELFGRSRIALSMNVTDGWPNSLLETMIMGAFPIQSDTISTSEWIENGRNGFLVPPEGVDEAAKAIRNAIVDDTLVDSAADVNLKMVSERIDRTIIAPQIISLYKKVLEQAKMK